MYLLIALIITTILFSASICTNSNPIDDNLRKNRAYYDSFKQI